MVWPTSPGAIARSRCLSCVLEARQVAGCWILASRRSKRYLNKELFASTLVGLFRANYDDESNGYGVVIDDDDIGLRPVDRSDERPPGPIEWAL